MELLVDMHMALHELVSMLVLARSCGDNFKPRLHVNFNSLPVVYLSTDPALEVGWNFNPDSLFFNSNQK